MGVTHASHPAADQTPEVWPQGVLDLLGTGPEGLVAGFPYTIVVVLET